MISSTVRLPVSLSPVSRRIDFKLAVLMYQISRGLAPTYLQDRCRLASEVSSQCSDVRGATREDETIGDRSFAAAGPRLYGTVCQGLCVNPRHSQPLKDN